MNFAEETSKLNITLTSEKERKFDCYYQNLIKVNSYMNLTTITEKEEVYAKHFLDSLSIYPLLPCSQIKLCDVGSGAGFPSVPLAIIKDNLEVTIIDALNKRIRFLNDLIQTLDLKNVIAFHQRAEDYAKEKREYFDVVTARAVAKLNILSELCLPLVKVGGYFIAMKGPDGVEELQESEKAIGKLGGKLDKIVDFELPEGLGKRKIIIIRKIGKSPESYPRLFSKIKEKPL